MKNEKRLLIVDDEAGIRRILQVAFEKSGYIVDVAENGEGAIELALQRKHDCVLTDVTMPGMNGYQLLRELGSRCPGTRVIVMTAFGTIPQAVQAIRDGAYEFVTKPFDLDNLKKVVGAAFADQGSRPASFVAPSVASGFVFASAAMAEVFETAKQVAKSRATVLITGESGVGKEVIANTIHQNSPRANHPYVAVSCAALPDALLESELFGHERGAFTGADVAKAGRFELANEGTLFLDEIGEIPMMTQVKLLRALQERSVERLGSATPVPVDVRLITATNRDLQAEVDRGTFRLDLLYRLQVVEINVPPLRERTEDIEPLAKHFISKFCRENGRPMMHMSDDGLEELCRFNWPGNVRELENTIERAVVLSAESETTLYPHHWPKSVRKAA